ncbi:hypothetical protein C0991_002485 [Blastosporella zonata]|nr:hypothetical protein C0991_002485 [Blastosporella zonata]
MWPTSLSSASLHAAKKVTAPSVDCSLQVHTTQTLAALEKAYKVFHNNKDIFVQVGVREHFNIPKLHQMQHYVDAIMSRGSADGYNTESPERLHIDFAKDTY